MSDADRILSEFMSAWQAGQLPDPDEYLDRVPEPERPGLSEQIRTYLAIAPEPDYDDATWATLSADPAAARAAEIPLDGPEPWPSLLPRLRVRAGLTWTEVARSLGVSRPEKAERFLLAMERGEHDPRRVTRRALDALARVLGVPADALGWTGGEPAPALLRVAEPSPAPLDLSALEEIADRVTRSQSDWDEVDELFLGGRIAG